MAYDYKYLDCDESVSAENLRVILDWLAAHRDVPHQAVTALEGLYKLAYDDKKMMSFTCRFCNQEFELPHVSGKNPTICKGFECQKAANRERVQNHRKNHSKKTTTI